MELIGIIHLWFSRTEGVFGAIIIEPKIKDPYEYDREYVISLSDWSDENHLQFIEN